MKYYNNILIYFLIIIFLITQSSSVKSSSLENDIKKKFRFGLLSGTNINEHSTHLPIIMDNHNCGIFTEGTSIGKNLGLIFGYEYLPDFLYFDSKIVFSKFDASFSTSKNDFRVYNPQKKAYEDVYIKYTFSSDIITFSFQPSIFLQPSRKIPLRLRIGADFSNPLTIPKYRTTEEIISPRIFTFPDQTQYHIIDNGELNQLGTSLSALGGIQYEHPLNNRFFISLELFYQYPLNSRSSNFKWETTLYGFNLMLTYGFNSLSSPQRIKESLPVEKPTEIESIAVEPTSKQKNITELILEPQPLQVLETTVTEAYPLLPYIFFEENSDKLNAKYTKENHQFFEESKLPHNSIEIYYHILDIIGKRLNENKKAKITIVGHTDGIEQTDKQEREKLAQSRAKNVADYLINKWYVNKNQTFIDYKELPSLPTSNIYEQGSSENRRVEIQTNDNQILKPVLLTKFKEYSLIPDEIEISLKSNDLNNVNLMSYQLNSSLSNNFNKDMLPKLRIPITKQNESIITNSIEKTQKIEFKLNYTFLDTQLTAVSTIPVVIERNSHEYQRLNLIVFDFDKYEISSTNYMNLKNFVANSIKENSEIRIIGSTDILGTKEYNLQLSKNRALATRNILQKLNPKANFVEVQGIGDNNLKYDNSTPEGRFYSRTVLIEVKTPIIK